MRLQCLEKVDIIEKVMHSEWGAAPVEVVSRGDGKIRLCGYKHTYNAFSRPLPLCGAPSGSPQQGCFIKCDFVKPYDFVPIPTINCHHDE